MELIAPSGSATTVGLPESVVATVRQKWQAFLQSAEGQAFLRNLDHGLTAQEAVQPEVVIRRMLTK